MDQAHTHRQDLRYVQTQVPCFLPSGTESTCTQERVVNLFDWIWFRSQFWRFDKERHAKVLREKRLDDWMR